MSLHYDIKTSTDRRINEDNNPKSNSNIGNDGWMDGWMDRIGSIKRTQKKTLVCQK